MNRIEVKTVLGKISAEKSGDLEHPGIRLCVEQKDGTVAYEKPVALVECTPDTSNAGVYSLRLLVWDDMNKSDHTDGFTFIKGTPVENNGRTIRNEHVRSCVDIPVKIDSALFEDAHVKDILQSLYDGEIYPAESIGGDKLRYQNINKQLREAKQNILMCLSEDKRKCFDVLDNLQVEFNAMYSYDSFAYGFRLALALMRCGLSS